MSNFFPEDIRYEPVDMKEQYRILRSKTIQQRIQEVAKLPLVESELWKISFTEVRDGEYWMRCQIEDFDGKSTHGREISWKHKFYMSHKDPTRQARDSQHGPPPAEFVLGSLAECMLNPTHTNVTGPPHRPRDLFIFYRLKYCYPQIQICFNSAGILTDLQTIEDAKYYAGLHGMDYLGRNVSCDHCGAVGETKRCGGCKKRLYCSERCQKADWKAGHKAECKRLQQKQQAK